jgi:uncharacterized protein (DUF2235 family)
MVRGSHHPHMKFQGGSALSHKNIVLCADGTGNKGGYTPDSNVFKIYNDVDIHAPNREQISYYDNGVGTSTNQMLKALSGAIGLGFQTNVCELYEFLARQYEPDDQVYLFGFSRGAATIRAFTGFIDACGLIDGRNMSAIELKTEVTRAFEVYKDQAQLDEWKDTLANHGRIPIRMVGVWDTVAALGGPQRTDITGPISFLLDKVLNVIDWIIELLWPHRFYNYALTKNIENAYQALAIDDERTSFWPLVWTEPKAGSKQVVEQTWFSGMHSNIGGGYAREGMANVTLEWMLVRAAKLGLEFRPGVLKEAKHRSNAKGLMYDSRGGFARFYRYHPREISSLCKATITGPVRIHNSVIGRLERQIDNYTPKQIPDEFAVVETELDSDGKGKIEYHMNPGSMPGWKELRKTANRNITHRKRVYAVFLIAVLFIVGVAIKFWIHPPPPSGRSGLLGHIADFLNYILPKMFDGLIEFSVVQRPFYFLGFLAFAAVFLVFRKKMVFNRIQTAATGLRRIILKTDKSEPVARMSGGEGASKSIGPGGTGDGDDW